MLCMFFCYDVLVFFFKQKTAYEMRISDWSSDVCSSDLTVNTISQPVCDLTASAMYGIICSGLLPVTDGNTPPPVRRVIITVLSPAAKPRSTLNGCQPACASASSF